MTLFSIILFICILFSITGYIYLRKVYMHKLEIFDKEIANKIVLQSPDNCDTRTNQEEEASFDDIEAILQHSFYQHIISRNEENIFTSHFQSIYNETCSLIHKLALLHIEPTARMLRFINDFESISSLVKQHNDEVTKVLLENNRDFFDHCLKYPLDEQQRRSIIVEEDNCLVISSAGSGKTSSIVGKVKYLTECRGIAPERILLISYTNKAAAELTERMGISGMRGYTFHKLALDLIGKVTGEKPSICENTDAVFIKIYQDLLSDKKFQEAIVEYFIDYNTEENDWEKHKQERREYLSEQKDTRIKAVLPDMDGNAIFVKSEQEQKICFALSSLGIKFRYEEPYEHRVADEMHSQYKPDFSIHYEKDGKTKRLYLEHFGINEHGMVPYWFAKDKGISYEEANKEYGDGITWKKAVHDKFKTKMISTSSADFHYYEIRDKLQMLLNDAGVPTCIKTEDELYSLILPKDSKKEKSFIRLIVTFSSLLKSSCKTINDILSTAVDERSRFIIKRIFQPVYEKYIEVLKEQKQIDFTDAILWATEICQTAKPWSYDYIIVDEFQDISVDRYHFLKALRNGNPPAKLYCVGDDWQSIYRFSGSDMALFNQFANYFGYTEICKIETTYRFGQPLVSQSSEFIQRNNAQIRKSIRPFNPLEKTELCFIPYERNRYCEVVEKLVASIPSEKSIFLLGRYSFDDYYLSYAFQGKKEGERFYYIINNRKIEFLTVHKSKGLEADYVILLQCNKDIYGFPSQISDDPVLRHVLTQSDQYPYGEERRLFYVAITRAKVKTIVLYDKRFPSVFVDEFIHPERITEESYLKHPNANKIWSRGEDRYLRTLYSEGKSIKDIAKKMGRSQTSIVMRLGKLGLE